MRRAGALGATTRAKISGARISGVQIPVVRYSLFGLCSFMLFDFALPAVVCPKYKNKTLCITFWRARGDFGRTRSNKMRLSDAPGRQRATFWRARSDNMRLSGARGATTRVKLSGVRISGVRILVVYCRLF